MKLTYTIKSGLDIKQDELRRHIIALIKIGKYTAERMLIFVGIMVVVIGLLSWIVSFIH